MADPRLRTIIVFKNHGEAAGTSLAHPHWQTIATPVVPRLLRTPVQLLRPLAEILKTVLTKFSALLDDPAFDILPRLTTPAGFALGSGMPINPMLPEEATRRLRGEPANATVGKGPP